MKVKKIFEKLLVSLLIILTLFNFISAINVEPNYSFATSESEQRMEEQTGGFLSNIANAFINVIFKWPLVLIGRLARSLNYSLASSGGDKNSADSGIVTPFDIFFNRFPLLDANIFSTSYINKDGATVELNRESVVYKIRSTVAVWYYSVRGVAILVIFVMLLINIFRSLAKSATPEQKVVAKNAISDWVLSFALVMFMHIIVILVLNLNEVLIEGIASFTENADASDFFDALEGVVFSPNMLLSFAALVVYAILNWQTLKYILVYIQRMLTISLLVIISPIVPVTYSLDRMRGGRGGALNGWLKELMFNVFIQPIHALIYAALVGVAMASLTAGSIVGVGDLGTAVVAIVSLLFIKYAEKMIKTIFGFDGSQILNTNVFSDVSSVISNATGTVVRAGARAATGGPIISFGKNVDGSHIGIGQVAQGVKTNVGNAVNTAGNTIRTARDNVSNAIKSAPGALGTAAGNAVNSVRSMPENLRNARDNAIDNIKDGFNASVYGEDEAETMREERQERRQERREERQERKEARRAERSGEDDGALDALPEGEGADKAEGEKEPIVVGGGVAGAREKQKNTDAAQNRRADDLERENRETREDLTKLEKSQRSLQDALKVGGKRAESNKKEVIREELDTQEINNEETETIREVAGTALDELSIARIKKELKDQIQPELMSQLSQMLNGNMKGETAETIKAIASGNTEKLKEINNNLVGQLEMMAANGTLSKDTIADIESSVTELWNKPDELGSYISALPKDSNERKYAETFAQLSTGLELADSQMSTEEKVEAFANVNQAINVKATGSAEGEVTPTGTSNVKPADNEAGSSAGVHTAGTSRTMQAVNEAVDKPSARTTEEIEENDNGNILDLSGRIETRKQEAIDGAREALLKLDVDAQTEDELISDFETRFTQTASSLKMETPSMDDIVNSLSPGARKEYNDFISGKTGIDSVQDQNALNAIALQREADAVARIQGEAARMGFATQVEGTTAYKATVSLNGRRTTFTSSSSSGVLRQLGNQKSQLEAESRKRNLA